MWQSKKAGLFNNIPNCELKKAYSKCEAESRFKLTCQKSGKNALTYESTDQNYTAQELMEIAEMMLSRRQYTLSVDAKEQMKLILNDAVNKYTNRGNARMVRNLVERVIRTQAVRLVRTKPFKLYT